MSVRKIIIALDFPNAESALTTARNLKPTGVDKVKVGKELFTAVGPVVVEQLMNEGFKVFLDLKFHDIPTTVAKACKVAAGLGVWMVNVHASGGPAMLEAAREAVDSQPHHPLLIAVTVLTSMNPSELSAIGMESETEAQVLRLATLAKNHGLDGVVCSSHEIPMLRQNLGEEFQLVTPGIRLVDNPTDDQKRVMSPREALAAGSDYLVIGRAVTRHAEASKTTQALETILASLEGTA